MTIVTQRYALALDLVDDDTKIKAYEKAHESIWPQVRDHLFKQGVVAMEIYRLGTRLFMVMDVDPAVYTAEAMEKASLDNEAIRRWETWMWTFQQPTPWTPEGQKWVHMRRVFEL